MLIWFRNRPASVITPRKNHFPITPPVLQHPHHQRFASLGRNTEQLLMQTDLHRVVSLSLFHSSSVIGYPPDGSVISSRCGNGGVRRNTSAQIKTPAKGRVTRLLDWIGGQCGHDTSTSLMIQSHIQAPIIKDTISQGLSPNRRSPYFFAIGCPYYATGRRG